ncbi:MAG: hypothetical protein ACP5HS_11575 [Anaerolineae bacterium]
MRHLRAIAAILLLTVVLMGLAYMWWVNPRPRSLASLCDLESSQITQVLIRDGTTGEARTTSDPEQIATILHLLTSVSYTRQVNQAPRAGYQFYVDLYETTEPVCRVTVAGQTASIGRLYYDLDRGIADELAEIDIPEK